MFNVKLYDSYNNEYQELRTSYEKLYAAEIHAILASRRKYIRFVIIEDDEFNRYGWYEDGKKICD